MKSLLIICMFNYGSTDMMLTYQKPYDDGISKKDSRRINRAINNTFKILRKRKVMVP